MEIHLAFLPSLYPSFYHEKLLPLSRYCLKKLDLPMKTSEESGEIEFSANDSYLVGSRLMRADANQAGILGSNSIR